MTDKFDYYDLISSLIPGMLLLGWVAFWFPNLVKAGISVDFPSAFATILLIALSLFLGQVVQAIASIAEPVIYWTWGGRPSDRAITKGIRSYIPEETAIRIRKKLEQAIGEQKEIHSLFLFAKQCADTSGVGLSRPFNALYAYHRGLLILGIISILTLLGSMELGYAASLSIRQNAVTFIGVILLAVLIWHRAKQRAFYYVREVLFTAEHVIDNRGTVQE